MPEPSYLTYLIEVLAISLPPGYLLSRLSLPNLVFEHPILVSMPIYLAMGLSATTVILSAVSLVAIDGWLIWLIFLPSAALMIFSIILDLRKSRITPKRCLSVLNPTNIVGVMLFLTIFLNFGLIADYNGWPPVGDALYHTSYASLLTENGKYLFNNYSPGLHILAANFSKFMGVFPGEAVYLLATTFMILIPLTVYSIAYIITKSTILSAAVTVPAFIRIPMPMEYYLVGYFYNGTYSGLFGLLSIILFCALTVILSIRGTQTLTSISLAPIALVLLQVAITYTPFIILAALDTAILLLWKHFQGIKGLITTRKLVIGAILFAGASLLVLGNSTIEQTILRRLADISGTIGYRISSDFLFTEYGIAFLSALLISVFFLTRRKYIEITLLYLIISLPSLLSIVEPLAPYLTIILPRRIIVISTLLSWLLIALIVYDVLKIDLDASISLRFKGLIRRVNIPKSNLVGAVCLIIFIAASASTALPNFTFGRPAQGWYPISRGDDNYNVLAWVSRNVGDSDLILNDYSYAGQYISAFSIKNITCGSELNQRAIDCLKFWKEPNTISLLRLVVRYNITYVLATASSGYQDYLDPSSEYKPRPIGYDARPFFDAISFMEKTYNSGMAAVYRVNMTRLQTSGLLLVNDPVPSYVYVGLKSGWVAKYFQAIDGEIREISLLVKNYDSKMAHYVDISVRANLTGPDIYSGRLVLGASSSLSWYNVTLNQKWQYDELFVLLHASSDYIVLAGDGSGYLDSFTSADGKSFSGMNYRAGIRVRIVSSTS